MRALIDITLWFEVENIEALKGTQEELLKWILSKKYGVVQYRAREEPIPVPQPEYQEPDEDEEE